MSDIQQNLAKILNSRYGRDVRQSIHDGIHNCYEDGKAGSIDLVARELIQQKMSGSPAGTYADLEALILANPDHSKIYITLDDGNWCYHNGSAWVAGGVYQATSDHAEIEAARGGETTLDTRLDIFDVKLCNIAKTTNRKNLLDQTAITDNTLVVPGTGNLHTHTAYYTTDYIPVTPGMAVSFQNEATTAYPSRAYDGARFVCCYDQNKTVVTPGFSVITTSFVVPSGVYFIRASMYRANKTSIRRPSINPCARLVEFTEYGAKKVEQSDAPEIANPARLWSVVNVPFTIYPKNITDADANAAHIAMPSTSGTNTVGVDEVTITDAAASSTLRTNFLLYSKRNGAAIKYGSSPRTAVAASSSNGTYKVLQIGDSTTAGGQQVTQMLARSAVGGEVTQITAVGTKGTAPALHEGISGWSYEECVTDATNNPFFNPATSRFDFTYYMTTTGLTGLNAVILALGINDLYSLTDRMDGDVEIDAKIAETIGYALEIVASIVAYDANIKVVVDTVIHGNALASKHSNNQTPCGYKRIVVRYNTALIEAMTPRGYHIAPTFLYLDPASDIVDNVHPTAGGYVKLGNVHFDMLKGVL